MFKVRSILVMLVLSALLAGQAVAQITSSNLRGEIVGPDGRALADASVEILHVPSSTVSRATSSASGRFFQSGLRVGGPYQITVARDGFQTTIIEGLFLDPGSQDPIRIVLESDAVEDRIVVMGARFLEAAELNSGVGSVFDATDIRNQPGVNRDVIQTLLRDPLAQSSGVGNLSVAGVNPRFNALAIDGSLQQDNFGLGANTYATNRSPINLDAVESVSLVASDYSVTASNFTGGLVNIVTRSGSNEWRGNAYYAYKNDSMVGKRYGDRRFDPGDISEKEYGFTLSGPILRDRLFFFLSYDEYDSGSPFDFTNSDATAERQPGFFDALRSVIQNTYNFDPLGRPTQGNIPETSERWLAKIDWNITDDHRASFTYQSTEETGASINANSFESAWYDVPLDLKAYTFQLFSDWSPNLSTNFRVNYTEFDRGQICRAGPMGELNMNLNPNDLVGTPLEGLLTRQLNNIQAGCDRFRHNNVYYDERLQLFGSADYVWGDHVLTFGAEWEEFDLFNLFLPNSRGTFFHQNYNQLINRTPSSVLYRNVPSNVANDAAAEWGFDRLALFLQDQWWVTPELQLSLGLRYERIFQSDEPAFSQTIFDQYRLRTDNNLDGNDLFMPRIGFLYTGLDRTTISGGVGLFAGGAPQVWVSNAYQAPFVQTSVTGVQDADLFTVPQEALDIIAAGEPIPGDLIAPGFKTPSDWKASLRYERAFDLDRFGDNWRFTAQYLYTRTNNGFRWEMVSQTRLAEALPAGVAPDGRPIYADLRDLGIRSLTMLTNYGRGDSHVFTLGLGKRFETGFEFEASYAHQNVDAVTEGTSSQGISNWRGTFDIDRNNPQARTSIHQVDHSFKINLAYENRFFGDLLTRVDAFGQITSGGLWSPTFRFQANQNNHLFGRAGAGEDPFNNNPLYVPDPAGDSRVVFGSGFNQAAFFEFVDENNIPTGQIVNPYSRRGKWNNLWDLRFQQQLPGIPGVDRFANENRFSVVVDVFNFLNLLNRDWGIQRSAPGFGQAPIVVADLVSAADVAANGIDGATALAGDAPRTTCRSEGDCVYRFTQFTGQSTSFQSGPRSTYEVRLTLRYDF